MSVVLGDLVLERGVLERADFSVLSASDTRIAQCRLAQVDLTTTTLVRAAFEDVVIVGGSWANIDVAEIRLRRVAFDGVRMTGADLSSSSIRDGLIHGLPG